MIEAEFAFFQVQIEGLFRDSAKLRESHFDIAPKVFDRRNAVAASVNRSAASGSIDFLRRIVDQAVVGDKAFGKGTARGF